MFRKYDSLIIGSFKIEGYGVLQGSVFITMTTKRYYLTRQVEELIEEMRDINFRFIGLAKWLQTGEQNQQLIENTESNALCLDSCYLQ